MRRNAHLCVERKVLEVRITAGVEALVETYMRLAGVSQSDYVLFPRIQQAFL